MSPASVACAAALLLLVLPAAAFFYASNDVPRCAEAGVADTDLYYRQLERSPQMPAQAVALQVGVPFEALVAFFAQPSQWPRWNHLFKANTHAGNYSLCSRFDQGVAYTNTQPGLTPPFPKDMVVRHWIDQHGFDAHRTQYAFGWFFKLDTAAGDSLTFGRHTFTLRAYVDASGRRSTIVSSWEKAAGPQLDTTVNQLAWTICLEQSRSDAQDGFLCLERVYAKYGNLTAVDVAAMCDPLPNPTPGQ
jgi:hypothetical protein